MVGYIYKIVNDINEKIYVGKTTSSIEERFKEHCKDCLRTRKEKRPLNLALVSLSYYYWLVNFVCIE